MITPHDLPGRAMSGTPPGSPDKQAEKEGRMAAEMYQKNIAQAQAENPTMDATSAGLETESPASMGKISNPLGNDANHDSNYKGKADEGFGKRTLVMWLLYLPVIFLCENNQYAVSIAIRDMIAADVFVADTSSLSTLVSENVAR